MQEAPGTDPVVRLAAAGDETAFARLIATHHRSMTRVAFVIVGDWDAANEATQAAWTIAWMKLGRLRDHDKVEPWLVSIAANEARKLIQRQRRRTVVEISAAEAPGSGGMSLAGDPADRISLVDLGRALRKLGPDDRSLIAMRYVAGFDSNQIGAAMGISGLRRPHPAGSPPRPIADGARPCMTPRRSNPG